MGWKRRRRVRLHLINEDLPRVDGLLVSRRRGEYLIAVPELLGAPGAPPVEPAGRLLAVPKTNVAFYEVLA